eukprot:COSAG06_NODE_769_length_12440_cov_7.241796_6_plen_58_part_00
MRGSSFRSAPFRAFEACDWDGSGTIDAEELHGILHAAGSSITLEMVGVVSETLLASY